MAKPHQSQNDQVLKGQFSVAGQTAFHAAKVI